MLSVLCWSVDHPGWFFFALPIVYFAFAFLKAVFEGDERGGRGNSKDGGGDALVTHGPQSPINQAGGNIIQHFHSAPADPPKERRPVIGLVCEPRGLPIPLPKGSIINTLCTQEGNGLAHAMTLSQEDDVWHPYPKSDHVYCCELTNYGEVPVFRVSMSFRVTLKEPVRQQGIWTSGKVVSSHVQIAELPSIDANGGKYVFYVWNSGDQVAEVFAPESVTLESTESDERIQVRLKLPSTHGPPCMALFPARVMK